MARAHGNLVKYHADNGVAVLTLDNGKVNGYSHEMMLELDDAILAARFDDAVHVILLTGARDVFCAGADTSMLGAVTPRFKYYFCLHANETLSRLEQTPKLVIAALNGHCVGGGLEIALAADLRIGIEPSGEGARAPKIGLPEVHLGVLPGTGGTQRMVRAIGKTAALEWMTRGDNRSFQDARTAGLITALLPAASPAEFKEKALEYVREFCPPRRASKAVGLIKRACQTGAEVSLEAGLALERELQQQLFVSDDAKEGIAAFNEKRKPEFHGR
jgi:enoyl-CoA hydratase